METTSPPRTLFVFELGTSVCTVYSDGTMTQTWPGIAHPSGLISFHWTVTDGCFRLRNKHDRTGNDWYIAATVVQDAYDSWQFETERAVGKLIVT
jgi:hypothetical protein